MPSNPITRTAFGDFQTPSDLANRIAKYIQASGFNPESILEPTCGTGSFLRAAENTFQDAKKILGYDINSEYVNEARLLSQSAASIVDIREGDFFGIDWRELTASLPKPLLIIGNPPWVTNSALSSIGISNTPNKSNVDHLNGIEALTGHSNFDISEHMIRTLMEALTGTASKIALLCKTSVARKALTYAWRRKLPIGRARIHRIDSRLHFDVSVDSCLLEIDTDSRLSSYECQVFNSLDSSIAESTFGFRKNELISNIKIYEKHINLISASNGSWRSGIKHDCQNVFELEASNGSYISGTGELVEIEDKFVFPLLKSSDLAGNSKPKRFLLVPQTSIQQSPDQIRLIAPKTWDYLTKNSEKLAKRASSIYKNRHSFSVFGVGNYTFNEWKIAVSGLYKSLTFSLVGPYLHKPVVFDDTCYFYPCLNHNHADLLRRMLDSDAAKEFYQSRIFWDSKRPITAQILNSLDLEALARELDLYEDLNNVRNPLKELSFEFAG
jgi:hypothetical protein